MSSLAHVRSPGPAGRQVVVAVDFESCGGLRWSAVGGGETLTDAIEFARDSVPGDRYWSVARIRELYGN